MPKFSSPAVHLNDLTALCFKVTVFYTDHINECNAKMHKHCGKCFCRYRMSMYCVLSTLDI